MLFTTYDSVVPAPSNCTIWQAARATSATPGLFHPITIGNAQSYIDGGLGCNNPTKFVLSEAATLYPGRAVACVISIGAGHPATIRFSGSNNILNTLKNIAGDCEATHEELSQRFQQYDRLYYRFSVEQGMQTTKEHAPGTSAEAEAHTTLYLTSHAVQRRLAEMAKVLLERQGQVPVEHLSELVDILEGVCGSLSIVSVPQPTAHPTSGANEEEPSHEKLMQSVKRVLSTRVAQQYRYSDQAKDECHTATRNKVLSQISEWITSAATRCMWMTGNAGVGKSAIAITASECLSDQRALTSNMLDVDDSKPLEDAPIFVAHYFCNHLLDSSSIHNLFPTLALQLAEQSPLAAKLVAETVEGRPSLINKLSLQQAQLIFLTPLCQLAEILAPKTLVIMIDGVDEFHPPPDTPASTLHRQVMEVLGSVARSLPSNARLLILSRPQHEILTFLNQHEHEIERLHLDTKESIPDVRTYFGDELPTIRGHHTLFPTHDQLEKLVQYSDGHLGWAKQTKKYLAVYLALLDSSTDLDEEIERIGELGRGDLYSLYIYLLGYLLRTHTLVRSRYLTSLQRVLHALVALQHPLSIDAISILTKQDDNIDVRGCLLDLSGLYADDFALVNGETIPQPHKSFYDFLVLVDTPDDFRVDPTTAHTVLASSCFRIILSNQLHFNMGQFITLHPSHEEVEEALALIPNLV